MTDARWGGGDKAGGRWLATALVLALMLGIIGVGVLVAAVPPPQYGAETHAKWGPSIRATTQSVFTLVPRAGASALQDEELFLGTLDGVRRGFGFYGAEHMTFMRSPGRWNTRSALAYRQPLLTCVWLVLGDGAAIGVAWAMLAAGSMFAAFAAARRFVRPMVAALAPAGLGLVWAPMLWHVPRILYTEMWAGPLAVVAGACCALTIADAGDSRVRRAWVLAYAGACAAILAMLVRELALVPVSVMALALLSDPAVRSRRLWTPYAGAIVLWLGAYAWHVWQITIYSAGDPYVARGGRIREYVVPRLGVLAASVRWVSSEPVLMAVVIALCALAALSVLTFSSASMRVLSGGLTLGMLAFLIFAGPPGVYPGGYFLGYWGYLFIPVAIAWAPLAFRLAPALRSSES